MALPGFNLPVKVYHYTVQGERRYKVVKLREESHMIFSISPHGTCVISFGLGTELVQPEQTHWITLL